MGIPYKLSSKKNVVFCYSSDLDKAAENLASQLGCPWVRIRLGKGSVKYLLDDIPQNGKVAWLVGHGLSTDCRIGSITRTVYVEASVVLGVLEDAGYEAVVDTCCQPDQRRLEGANYSMDFYSTDDGRDVKQIGLYKDADTWWDDHNIKKR